MVMSKDKATATDGVMDIIFKDEEMLQVEKEGKRITEIYKAEWEKSNRLNNERERKVAKH